MKRYEVKKTIVLAVQPGSVVVLSDAQAEAVSAYVKEVPDEAKKKAKKE